MTTGAAPGRSPAEALKLFDTQFVERSVSMQVELNGIECCVRIIEELREENALLRNSATMFGALAERLNRALARERGVQATTPEDLPAHDALGVRAPDLDGSASKPYFSGG